METDEQRTLLRSLGCEVAQGYLFSRPVPMAALMAWASERRYAEPRDHAHRPDAGLPPA